MGGSPAVLQAVEEHRDYIEGEVLEVEIEPAGEGDEAVELNDEPAVVAIVKC